MNILFISRAYPPVVGGIERLNHEAATGMAKLCNLRLLANTRGKKWLPIFFISVLARGIFLLPRTDVVFLGDGVLSVIGYFFKLFSKKPVVSIVVGLDLTYGNDVYQSLWVGRFLPRLDRLIAASQETIDQGVARGLSAARFRLVPYGVKAPVGTPEYSRKDLEKLLNREIQGTVLLTLGRLVKRKGVSWFVGAVMSRLADSTVYIVAGGGEERASIAESARRAGIGDRVFLLGAVADEVKELLYATSDIFVQSNIAVPGDMEGFGLVVLEAASYGLPVVASNLEGLKDAIRDGQSGFLVAPGDADAYVRKLDELTRDPTGRKRFGQGAREYVIANMSWGQVADRYLAVCKEALASHEGINGPQTS